jgi:hypothetical protein
MWQNLIKVCITNLTSHDLVIKIMPNLFIIHMFHTLISCIENTFETLVYRKMRNLYDIYSFIGLCFICWHIYLCVKSVFNTWYLCLKWINLWMNKFHTNFIINLSHAKFVMCVTCHDCPNGQPRLYMLILN